MKTNLKNTQLPSFWKSGDFNNELSLVFSPAREHKAVIDALKKTSLKSK